MPALITHQLFGERCLDALPAGTVRGTDERAAFSIGTQGPDPLFFRFSTLPSRFTACHKLSSTMHRTKVAQAFSTLAVALRELSVLDERVGRAWALGFITHYALDSTAHPWIYAHQAEIIAAGGLELVGTERAVHAIIESELDSWLLWTECHQTVLDRPPVDFLEAGAQPLRVGGELLAQVAGRAYGADLGASEYAACVADMRMVYELIEPAGSPRSSRLAAIERLFRDQSQLESMGHQVWRSSECASANLGHAAWRHPDTGAVSTASFPELLDQAYTMFAQLSAEFLEGRTSSFGAVNYRGTPLAAGR